MALTCCVLFLEVGKKHNTDVKKNELRPAPLTCAVASLINTCSELLIKMQWKVPPRREGRVGDNVPPAAALGVSNQSGVEAFLTT